MRHRQLTCRAALWWLVLLACAIPAQAFADALILNRWPSNVKFPTATARVEPKPKIKIKMKIQKPGEMPKGNNEFIMVFPSIGVVGPPLPMAEPNPQILGIAFTDASDQERLCSGLYVDARHVLTAKHCTCHGNDYLVTNNPNMFAASARWTRARLEPGFQGGAPCRSLRDFNPSEGNDIAILTLDNVLDAPPGKSPDGCFSLLGNIRLLDVWAAGKPRQLTVSGYGSTTFDGLSTGKWSSASIPINSLDCSVRAARTLGCVAYREMIMGLKTPGKVTSDSCPGDSGGPAYFTEGGDIFPVALVSRGVISGSRNLCGNGGIYTLLGRTDVIAWLYKRLPNVPCTKSGE